MAGVVAALIAVQLASSTLASLERGRQLRGSAQSLEDQALQALELGRVRAERAREEGERVGGDIRALSAAAGLELTGSPLTFEIHNAMRVERQAGDILWASKVQANNLRIEADRRRQAGGGLAKALPFTAATIALVGADRGGFFSETPQE